MIDYHVGGFQFAFIFSRKGSIVPKAMAYAVPSVTLCFLSRLLADTYPDQLHVQLLGQYLKESQLWSALNAVLVLVLAFRSQQALARFWEGVTLLHKARAEWFDACSALTAFSSRSVGTLPSEVVEFQNTLVRLMSAMHGCALHQIKEGENEEFDVIDIQGLDDDSLRYLNECRDSGTNRLEVFLHWIEVLITENIGIGVIAVPPPIVSRVYQELSKGLVNLHNARKIADTPFPFPYAQIIALLLLFHLIATPIILSTLLPSYLWACSITLFTTAGMWSINLIAGQLEQPFGDDENDLPIETLQVDMNASLLMLLDPRSHKMPTLKTNARRCNQSLSEVHGTQNTNEMFMNPTLSLNIEMGEMSNKRRKWAKNQFNRLSTGYETWLSPPSPRNIAREKRNQSTKCGPIPIRSLSRSLSFVADRPSPGTSPGGSRSTFRGSPPLSPASFQTNESTAGWAVHAASTKRLAHTVSEQILDGSEFSSRQTPSTLLSPRALAPASNCVLDLALTKLEWLELIPESDATTSDRNLDGFAQRSDKSGVAGSENLVENQEDALSAICVPEALAGLPDSIPASSSRDLRDPHWRERIRRDPGEAEAGHPPSPLLFPACCDRTKGTRIFTLR